ncbi:MAG: hypothetical protein ACO1OG_02030 [Devosia sp.]
MIDREVEHFDVRAVTARELREHVHYAKNMLLAAAVASLSIVGAGAYLLSLL